MDEPDAPGLRPARAEDRDLLLAWANDPITRAAGFHPERIDLAAHEHWLTARLADPLGRLWIGEAGGRPVGQLRVDRDETGRGIVGISMAPDARRRGLAGALLRAGMASAVAELGVTMFVAFVRPDNEASLRLFARAGYIDTGPSELAGVPCRVLVRSAWDGAP